MEGRPRVQAVGFQSKAANAKVGRLTRDAWGTSRLPPTESGAEAASE